MAEDPKPEDVKLTTPPQSVENLQPAAVMISPADLKELLNLQQQLNDLRAELVEAKKLPVAIGETACTCRGCNLENIVQPGEPGYKEVKDAETGKLLPYMPAGQHAA